jgi:uncharacterized protein (TIGR02231 family)
MTDTTPKLAQDDVIPVGEGNRLVEVVVFSRQALLKRRTHARTEQGLNRFLLEVQAFAVDPESVQAAVYGEGEILGVQYQEIPVQDAPQEAIGVLEARRRELAAQRKGIQGKREVLGKQSCFLDAVLGFAQIELPKEIATRFPEPQSLQTLLDFLGGGYQKLAEQDQALETEQGELDRQLAVLESQLQQLQGTPRQPRRKAIEILFNARRAQTIAIEAAYVVPDASWEAVYKVDVSADLKSVALTMFARIRQQTGEAWRNLKLAVSSAIPLVGAGLPDLPSWPVRLKPPDVPMPLASHGVAQTGVVPKRSRLADDASALEDSAEPHAVAAAPHAEFSQVEQHELPLAFEYTLAQPVNLESGEGDTLLPLYTKDLKGAFFLYAAPKQDPLIYLVCQATPDSDLSAGRLNVHFGGRFVASTRLDEKKAGAELLINLGAERSVKLRREKIIDKLTETFIGIVDRLSTVRELQYRIVIENPKDNTVRVRLLDNIPVSLTDRIQIKGVELHPEPTIRDYQQREGVMVWDLELAAHASQEIRLRFFVKYPKDSPVLGL